MRNQFSFLVLNIMMCLTSLLLWSCEFRPNFISVDDFGAIPGDSIDDSKSILAAIEYANKKGVKTVHFRAGVYEFMGLPGWGASERGKRSCYITLNDINDLNLVGSVDEKGAPSTYFLKTNDLKEGQPTIMSIDGGSNVSLQNIAIDMSPYYYSAGRVLKIEGDKVEIEVLDGHPVVDGQKTYIMGLYDIEAGKAKVVRITWDSELPHWKIVGDIESRCMAMDYNALAKSCQVGDGVFWFQGNFDGSMLSLSNINGILLENVHVLNGHGFPISNNNCHDITYRNVSVKPVGNRIASVCRDGFKIFSGSGKVLMDRVHIEGCLGDDGQNIHGSWLSAILKRSDKELVVSSSRRNLNPGKEIVLLDNEFLPAWRSKVVKCVSEGSNMVITFADSLPEWVHEKTCVEPQEWLPDSLHIVNSVYRSNGRFGVLLKASNTLIDNCLFENNVAGIHMGGEWSWGYWLESTNPKHIEIRNCTFRDNHLDMRYAGKRMDMAISIASWTNPGKLGEPSEVLSNLISDVLIHDNLFENETFCVSLQNCGNVWFWNNTLKHCGKDLLIYERTAKNIFRSSP